MQQFWNRTSNAVQYFLRMCDVTEHIHHGQVSLSLKYYMSESMKHKEFHTNQFSKIKHKIQVTASPIQHLPQRSPPVQSQVIQHSY